MPADMFLKIDGIKGESTDDKHKDEIEVLSWSWGLTQSAASGSGTGGLGAGRATAQDFHFVKRIDTASPLLAKHCASGQHIKSALLTLRKAGKEQVEYTKINFSDLMISSYATGGSEGGGVLPNCQVSFTFAKIKFEYWPQKPDGTLGGVVPFEWDTSKNKVT